MLATDAIESFRKAQLLKKQQQQQEQNEETVPSISSSPNRTLLKSASSPGGTSVLGHSSLYDPKFNSSAPDFQIEDKSKRPPDLRQRSLEMYKSLNNMMSMMNKKDSTEVTEFPIVEMEGFAVDYAWSEMERLGPVSAKEILGIREIVDSILKNEIISALVVDDPAKAMEFFSVEKTKSWIDQRLSPFKQTKSNPPADTIHPSINSHLGLEAYAFATQGSRKFMEDQHILLPSLNELFQLEDNPPQGFFAIYDGHVGNSAAIYSKAQLHTNMVQDFREKADSDVNGSIHHAYLKTNQDFNRMAKRIGITAGTTALTALIRKESIYLANAGDSEAVLCKDGKAILLSTSHLPDKEDEKARIHKAGGTVVWFGTWRVNGLLSVSRGIGDPNLDQVVIADPAIARYQRTAEDEFLILASDGLWGTVKYQDACDFVREKLNEPGDPAVIRAQVGRLLTEEAIRRKSADNVTAIVIFFHPVQN